MWNVQICVLYCAMLLNMHTMNVCDNLCICVHSADQWNHIKDLDDFFTQVYHYHQRGGLFCMALEDILKEMYGTPFLLCVIILCLILV